jgi:hypothetical protein
MTAYCLSKYGQDSPLSPKGHSTFISYVEQIKDKTCPMVKRGDVPCV